MNKKKDSHLEIYFHQIKKQSKINQNLKTNK